MPKSRKTQQTKGGRVARVAASPIRSPWVRTALFILICLAIWTTVNMEGLHDLAQARIERDQALSAQRAIENELDHLRDQRQALAMNTDAIERAARNEARMTRPGEVLVLIEREETDNH